jgi:uncharacterized protein
VKVAFVDTLYFVALFNSRDQWHERAIAASKVVAETKLITTEDVLVELLNFFSEYGEKARRGAVTQAEGILSGANIEVRRRAMKHSWRVSLFTKHAPIKVIA